MESLSFVPAMKHRKVLQRVVTDHILAVRLMKVLEQISHNDHLVDIGDYNRNFLVALPTVQSVKMWADIIENIPGLLESDQPINFEIILGELEGLFNPSVDSSSYCPYVQKLAEELGVTLPQRSKIRTRFDCAFNIARHI